LPALTAQGTPRPQWSNPHLLRTYSEHLDASPEINATCLVRGVAAVDYAGHLRAYAPHGNKSEADEDAAIKKIDAYIYTYHHERAIHVAAVAIQYEVAAQNDATEENDQNSF